jgi:TPR repeat protein
MKAVRSGSNRAMNNLANMYLNGRGVKKNVPLALAWWLRAAEKGNYILLLQT